MKKKRRKIIRNVKTQFDSRSIKTDEATKTTFTTQKRKIISKTDFGLISFVIIILSVYPFLPSSLAAKMYFSHSESEVDRNDNLCGTTDSNKFYEIMSSNVIVRNHSFKIAGITSADIFPNTLAATEFKTKVLHIDKHKIRPFGLDTITLVLYFEWTPDYKRDTSASFRLMLRDDEGNLVMHKDNLSKPFSYDLWPRGGSTPKH